MSAKLFKKIVLISFAAMGLSAHAFAGVIGHDDRLAIADFAKNVGMTEADARKKFAASGRIMCPFNEGTAFLVGSNDTIVTARHNQRDARVDGKKTILVNCAFEVSLDGASTWYEIDPSSIEYPDQKQRSATDRFDWIVMKLKNPVVGVTPYRIPTAPIELDTSVTVASIRQDDFPHDDWNERVVSTCAVRKVWNIDGIAASGLETDCDLTDNATGAPVLRETKDGMEVIGIQSSGNIEPCQEFAPKKCGNWAVGFTDEIAKAVQKLALLPPVRKIGGNPARGGAGIKK